MAAYYGANRDAKRTYQAKYRAANAEKVRRVDAARYAARRDQRLGWQIAYGRDNPHVQWRNGYRKRARRYGFAPVVEDFTRADVIARHGAACTHCGGPFEELDHYPVPVALGGHHTLENVRPSCVPCNRAETAAIRERRRAS
jgi:5-methylcytosine-specific restriction endonuclease McrA